MNIIFPVQVSHSPTPSFAAFCIVIERETDWKRMYRLQILTNNQPRFLNLFDDG